ncbi:MAG: DUF2087 domain-containing protein [Lachnospiraceae bacterium]|nr:DUF2087 domain-containing protein [Lachnospiraceae bacterium]
MGSSAIREIGKSNCQLSQAEGGQLRAKGWQCKLQYPSKRPMRIIVLIKIVEHMEANRKYTEKEINEIIKSHIAFSDIELIRREMYQYKLLGRLRDGSEYWVETGWRNEYAEYIRED